MNYALFGISYYKTVLLKNDTYKVVAAVFRDIMTLARPIHPKGISIPSRKADVSKFP